MRICMVSSAHPVFDDRIFWKQARGLVKRGHEVHLVVPGNDTRGTVEGVHIHLVPAPRSKYTRPLILASLYRAARAIDADIYVCHEPESALVGWRLKRTTGASVVYDVHEHYPSNYSQSVPAWARPLFSRLVNSVEKFICRRISGLCTVNETLQRRLNTLAPSVPSVILFNCPEPEFFPVYQEERSPMADELLIVHDGSLSYGRGLAQLVEVLGLIRKQGVVPQFLAVGTIKVTPEQRAELEGRLKELGITEFRETGWVDYKEVAQHLRGGVVGLILFQATHYNNLIGLPNKLFDYAACGVPCVASDFIEIGHFLRSYRCGVPVDPNKPEEIAQRILELHRNRGLARELGLNGKQMVRTEYNWDVMSTRLAAFCSELVPPGRR